MSKESKPAAEGQLSATLRLAQLEDVDFLHELIDNAYRKFQPGAWTTEASLVSGERVSCTILEEYITQNVEPIHVAVLNIDSVDVIVGCIQTSRTDNDEGMLGLFSVMPQFQSRGIGTTLIMHAMEYLRRTWSCTRAVMWVIESREELLKWYFNLGFVDSGMKMDFALPDQAKSQFQFVVIKKDLATM